MKFKISGISLLITFLLIGTWHLFFIASYILTIQNGILVNANAHAATIEKNIIDNNIVALQKMLWSFLSPGITNLMITPKIDKDPIAQEIYSGISTDNNFVYHGHIKLTYNGLYLADLKYQMSLILINSIVLRKYFLLYLVLYFFVILLLQLNNFVLLKSIKGIEKQLLSATQNGLDTMVIQNGINHFHNIRGYHSEKIASAIAELFGKILVLLNNEVNLKKASAIAEVAAQVAHDIRSPLAALEMMMKDLEALAEDKRIIMRSAVARIQDIANDLLNKNHQMRLDLNDKQVGGRMAAELLPQQQQEKMQNVLLSGVLESIISEKRIQYRGKPDLVIDLQLGTPVYGIFASIQVQEFKRVMSNLVNNAVEAQTTFHSATKINDRHLVTVIVHRDDKTQNGLILEISDNGCGITPEILALLGEDGGHSFGKSGGNGMGLMHAKKTVKSWGGQLMISSGGIGQGAQVQIRLLERPAPTYFLPELRLDPEMEIVVVDDDYSIHQIWQGRLLSLRAGEKNIRFRSFTDLQQFLSWHQEQQHPAPASHRYLYLVDYEFLGKAENGIDVIERLQLADRAVLVTSRHEEEAVIARCEKLHIKMLPKGLAGFVPIEVNPAVHNIHILVDDDPLIRMLWQAKAKEKSIHLESFSAGDELLRCPHLATWCPKTTTFYLDVNLGDGERGANLALALSGRGFNQIYLATGYDRDEFAHLVQLNFIRGVMGKIAPW